MINIADATAFVKAQIDYQTRRAIKTREVPSKLKFHNETEKQFRDLLSFLEDMQNSSSITQNKITSNIDPTGVLMPIEIVGLPQELIDELSGAIDKQELLIVKLIDSAGGTLSLDRILIGIYKETKEVIKRPLLTAKLYRMANNGMIFRVPKKKGLYTTSPVNSSDIEQEEEDT